MKIRLLSIVLILIKISIYANDGGIAIVSGTLYPVDIANVSMDYERLFITCKQNHFEIEAYIELYNHNTANSEPLLGFEFHEGTLMSQFMKRSVSDVIREFILLVNNEPQIFEYGVQHEYGLIHTLIYRPRLNPGKNTIYHKFQLPYGGGSFAGVVSYILKTSSRWKDGVIKNLEIFIRSDFNTIIGFESHYGINDNEAVMSFDTIGESKLYKQLDRKPYPYISSVEEYSLTPGGYLYKSVNNFVPDANIYFQLFKFTGMDMYWNYDDPPYTWPRENAYITIHDWKSIIENPDFRRYRWGEDWTPSEKMLESLSTEQLRILRNSLYAIHGLFFNDRFLQDYFNRQYWYFPNPNISQSDIVLSPSEIIILQYIIAEERRR
jgi:hypothetical protein